MSRALPGEFPGEPARHIVHETIYKALYRPELGGLTPHQWRHTLGTQMINRDVPQEAVRRILDHDSHRMTGRYAQLSDTTIRRHWEAARKVNINGETVTLDPDGPLAEAAWASQRLGRATQALPNGYCGLPVVKACPHANACFSARCSSPPRSSCPSTTSSASRSSRSSPPPKPAASSGWPR